MTASMRTRSASTTSTRRILDYMFKRSLRANDDMKNIVDFSLSLHALDIQIHHMVFSCVWGIQISSREVFACLGMYHEENALFMILNDILFFFNVFFMDLMYLNGGARMSQEVRPQYTPFILGFIIYNPLIRSPLIHPLPGRDIQVLYDGIPGVISKHGLNCSMGILHCGGIALCRTESLAASWWRYSKIFGYFHPRISGEFESI